MKKSNLLHVLLAVLAVCSVSAAETSDAVTKLKLVPVPREVRVGAGRFLIGPNSAILLDPLSSKEDRTAAETLAQEIADRAGIVVPIRIARREESRSGVIALRRLSDPEAVKVMRAHGLQAEKNFDPQGYLLFADESGIVIAANRAPGVFYGAQTLRQLLKPAAKGLACPQIAIKDWPAMQWRGIQDDMSRGPIPTLAYMKKQIRTIAAYKMNLFALYMEHVFDYESQPLIAPKEAAITPAELKELVAYGQKYHVTLLPEQQTFGHLHNILKYDVYSEQAEKPHGQALTPASDTSYQLIASMYAELAPLTPGPFLHIGTDEVFELGKGRSKARTDAVGIGTVYGQHLLRVHDLLQPYHKRLIFWGDIANDYPEQLQKLPKDMIGMPWNYEPRDSFADLLEPFKHAGLDIFVAPGAENWGLIWPNLEESFLNVRNFVRDGQKYGALGLLNTTWNDDGEAMVDMCWPAFLFGAAAGWQPGEISIEDFKNSYDWAFYRNTDTTFRDVIDHLDQAHTLLKSVGLEDARNELFWANPFTPAGASQLQKAVPVAHDLRLSAEQALAVLYRSRNLARANADSLDSLIFAAARLDALGMKIQFSTEMNRAYWDSFNNQANEEKVLNNFDEITGGNARLDDLRDATTQLRGMEEAEWARQYAPYWHNNVLLRYDRLAWILDAQIDAVREAEAQYRVDKKLPQPEQLGFLLKP
jgi:hexosaminidase